jgi:hypothetical protein
MTVRGMQQDVVSGREFDICKTYCSVWNKIESGKRLKEVEAVVCDDESFTPGDHGPEGTNRAQGFPL